MLTLVRTHLLGVLKLQYMLWNETASNWIVLLPAIDSQSYGSVAKANTWLTAVIIKVWFELQANSSVL